MRDRKGVVQPRKKVGRTRRSRGRGTIIRVDYLRAKSIFKKRKEEKRKEGRQAGRQEAS